MKLKVWKLHPQAARIEPAERTLRGQAHPDALKWCGPYTSANKYGFWLYPPVDLDVIWKGDSYEGQMSHWDDSEISVMKSLKKEGDPDFVDSFGGRVKVDFGRVEPNIVQIWTGLSFQMPENWSLLIRSPINVGMDAPYRIQEGILEVSWMRYDIWINVAIQHKNVLVSLRRDQWPPLAQLVPVPRNAYEQWDLEESMFHRDDEDGDKAYRDWVDYNWEKYIKKMGKDPATYHRKRRDSISANPAVCRTGQE